MVGMYECLYVFSVPRLLTSHQDHRSVAMYTIHYSVQYCFFPRAHGMSFGPLDHDVRAYVAYRVNSTKLCIS